MLSHPLFRAAAALVAASALATDASAVTTVFTKTASATNNSTADVLLGSTKDRTCFLSAVSGNLVGNPAFYSNPNGGLPAFVGIVEKNGSFFLRVRDGVGPGVKGTATCINVTAGRTGFSWSDNLSSGEQPPSGQAGDPNLRCFLSQVWSASGMTAASSKMFIHTANGHNDFTAFVQHFGGDMNFGGAEATCVHYVASGSWGFTFTGGANTTTTAQLRNFFPNGPQVPVKDVGCFLTGIAGDWVQSPDPLGINDGATLTSDGQATPHWVLKISNSRTAQVGCIH